MGSLFAHFSLLSLENKGSRAAPREVAKMDREKCDLGMLQTSKTKPACWREHGFRVSLMSRKNLILGLLILGLFWMLILESLVAPLAENKVSGDV